MSESVLYRWDDRSLSIGSGRQLEAHSHAAAELVFSLGEPFDCHLQGAVITGIRSLLLPPDTQHQNIHRERMCPIIYLDPEGRDYSRLSAGLTQELGVFVGLPMEDTVRGALQSIYADLPAPDTVFAMLDEALFGSSRSQRVTLDERVTMAISEIRSDLTNSHAALELADLVGLSEHHFLHLFKETVGIPFRKYRLWLRLKRAGMLILEGQSMTYAAHESGFTDAAHYSHTFRKMFGSSPSALLGNDAYSQVFWG